MLIPRVIPCLLLRNGGLVKTIRFQNPSYVGDPTNAIKIFNQKEVDELVVLDITATAEGKAPPFPVIERFASECFMPVAYGGGLHRMQDVREIFRVGIEKIVVNTAAVEDPAFVREASACFGAQAVVVSIDARRQPGGGWEVYTRGGRKSTRLDPQKLAVAMQQAGAGEIFLNSIDQDGTMEGYDVDLIHYVASAVDLPVIACGGAGKLADIRRAIKEGRASAAAAGSMVVYFGRNRAVLINFPSPKELEKALA
jgi:cyclase